MQSCYAQCCCKCAGHTVWACKEPTLNMDATCEISSHMPSNNQISIENYQDETFNNPTWEYYDDFQMWPIILCICDSWVSLNYKLL